MHVTTIITLSASVCAFIIALLLIIGALLGCGLKEKVYRWFFAMLIANLLGTTCEIVTACMVGIPGDTITYVMQIVDFANYSFGCCVLSFFAIYLYEYLSMGIWLSKRPIRIAVILNIANIILLSILQLTKHFDLLDNNNHYNANSMLWLLQILPALSMIVLIAVPLKNAKHLRMRESVSIIVYFIIQIVCYIIESRFIGVWVSYLGSAVSSFIMYVNIQIELKHTIKEKELELTQSRVAIMLSQIQPHFLYNTLGAIDMLYYNNPEEGHTAIVKFSSYLRGNMDSITNKKCIPFTVELDHVKQYLWLEQLRFEENLRVHFDIRTDAFELPVLTMQPLVENAVRHGVTRKKDGGNITIKAWQDRQCYIVEVADDGVGYNPEKPLNDGHDHVGIKNVRERISIMCGGTLSIQSEPGIGTTATIKLPKGEVFK